MRFLFASGGAYPPHTYGGAELSMHQLARELARRGHACEAVAQSRRSLAAVLRGHRPDRGNGYPTARARDVPALVEERLRAARPDLVVTWNAGCLAIARAAARAGVAVMVWVPDVGFVGYIDWLPRGTMVTAASRFVADKLRAGVAVEARVLYPFIELDDPRAHPRRPEHITFLNPHRNKGSETVLEVAALLPRRRFVIVDSRSIPRRERRWLHARAAELPNLTLAPPANSLAGVYARTALLLVPSRIEDASPRVILEAQASGIPVVASRIGGIPELLGDGGTLVAADAPAAVWADAIDAALADPRATHLRPELTPGAVVDGFLELARAAA